MSKRKIIITSVLSFIFFIIGFRGGLPVRTFHLTPVHMQPNYISDNQYKIDILKYDLNINLHTDEKSLDGDIIITGTAPDASLQQIDLNFYDNMKIEGVWLNGKETSYINLKTRLTIPAPVNKTDTFSIRIKYNGNPVRAGLSAFTFGKINGQPVVYNINEPTFASTWFPCNDIPSDKALLKIHITNDSAMTSVSNGKLAGIIYENGKRTFHWETLYPISTYLVAVYSARYENFYDKYISTDGKDTLAIEYYSFPGHVEAAKKDFKDHPKIIKVLSEIFGEYPFIKEKYGVAEFLWQVGAMENQTITGIGSNFVTGDRYFNDIYIHELAHSWWGNAVGPADWKDIWLNEGFATYSEALYDEYVFGKNALISNMMSKFDADFSGRLYDPGDNLFSNTVYSKGAWVLHMLRWETGDSVFFSILKNFYEKYKYKTASTRDFQLLSETLAGRDLSWFFNQWVLEGEDQVNLEYNWEYEKSSNSIILKTRQTQSKYNPYKFTLEFEIIYQDKNDTRSVRIEQKEQRFVIPADGIPEKITIDPKNRILANYSEKDF